MRQPNDGGKYNRVEVDLAQNSGGELPQNMEVDSPAILAGVPEARLMARCADLERRE
jgi:hypothetical protein